VTGGALHFDHDAWRSDGWRVHWNDRTELGHTEQLSVEQPRPEAPKQTADEKARKRYDLLRKRIGAMPDRIAHRVGLMKHYFDLRQYDEARKLCVACIEKWPDYWWSYMMLAKIESRMGDQKDSERRLIGLAERWGDFFGYAFLAQFHFDRREFDRSKESLRSALKTAPTRHKDRYAFEQIGHRDCLVDDCYYHNAAHLAYRMDDRMLCLEICDQWKRFVKEIQGYGGVEERVLRIVCAVNDSEWDRAKVLFEAMRHDPDYAPWQEVGIQKVGDVINDKNPKYVYDPKLFRNSGSPLDVEFNYK
jgi:tetratricopeptide (TPR) repeat protein